MTRNVVIFAFLVIPLAALVMAICGPRVKPPMADGALRDARGRMVTAFIPARRAVLFPPLLGIYLTVDGGSEHIRAVARYQMEDAEKGLLRYVYPALAALSTAETIDNTANPADLEQVELFHSDAVVCWSQFSYPLRQIGAPLVEVDGSQKQHEQDTIATWRLLAAVTGKADWGDRLTRHYIRERDQVLSKAAGESGRPRVLYVYRTNPGSMLVASNGVWQSRLLEAAGGINAASGLHGAWVQVTMEQLLILKPNIIIVSEFADDYATRAIYDDPVLRSLPTVKARQVYRQPSGGTRMEGLVEEPLLLEWMAEILHPDTMPRNYRDKLRATYAFAYGVTLSDDAIDANLRMDENTGSAGYERFARGADTAPQSTLVH
jgi:iron complex transport system substrate-binding protein